MLLAVVGSALGYSYVQRGSWRSPSTPENHRRAGRVVCWTGSTVARYEIKGVPISYLYAQYADLRRMTEWSPSLESVSISPEKPANSVWVMRVPRAIQAAARTVGYPEPTIEWEAVLDAPGPPLMTWTSEIRDDGSHQNAGFIPSGAVAFAPTDDDVAGAGEEHACEMTLTGSCSPVEESIATMSSAKAPAPSWPSAEGSTSPPNARMLPLSEKDAVTERGRSQSAGCAFHSAVAMS